jgi:serine/threonine protein kinase
LESIGKYQLKSVLGRGATSVVYLGVDPFFQREVAVKVFDACVFRDSGESIARMGFMVEAALLGKLNHPHIVQVLDAIEGPDDYYVVNEYVPGGTLAANCMPGNLMDAETVADVIYKCAKALEYVHSFGVFHRDIKPENILVGREGDIKLADFGAAFLPNLAVSQTVNAGSPHYMAPECLQGRDATIQSDIFSLGATFYHLLTGEKPFLASNMNALLYQMTNVPPSAPSAKRPGLPVDLDNVVLKSLLPNPSDRHPSWQAFVQELGQAHFGDASHGIRKQSLLTAAGRFTVLRAIDFFSTFNDIELWEVVHHSSIRRFVEGDVLLREGTPGRGFLVLLEGSSRITKQGKAIDLVEKGSSVGEIAHILGADTPRNTSCIGASDGYLLEMESDTFELLSGATKGRFNEQFLRTLATRVVDGNRRLSHA